MNEASPPWWSDVRRSRENALRQFEETLDRLEFSLSGAPDYSQAALNRNFEVWSALALSARTAAGMLTSSRRLADARLSDARSSGFDIPDDDRLNGRAEAAAARYRRISDEIRLRLSGISRDLKQRGIRRTRTGPYRNQSPSYIDVHV